MQQVRGKFNQWNLIQSQSDFYFTRLLFLFPNCYLITHLFMMFTLYSWFATGQNRTSLGEQKGGHPGVQHFKGSTATLLSPLSCHWAGLGWATPSIHPSSPPPFHHLPACRGGLGKPTPHKCSGWQSQADCPIKENKPVASFLGLVEGVQLPL